MNVVNLRIEIYNPFDHWDHFRNFGCLFGRISQHKAWELEHSYYSPLLLDVQVRCTHKQDHAGISVGLGLLGYGVSFRIYDKRHWNDDKNQYYS
jgi:lipoprotein signal peptidase